MTPQEAIIQAAQEHGIDPSTALAIAERESSFNPNEQAKGSSAFGLFQLLKSERNTYGGNSSDPYEQASAWANYIQGTKAEMAKVLGRDPTGQELYLGHYFGGVRAARMVSGAVPGETPVTSLFSPKELAANPNIVRAGTTGGLSSSIMGDIGRRTAKFAGAGVDQSGANNAGGLDLSQWGQSAGALGQQPASAPAAPAQPKQPGPDLSQFGAPAMSLGGQDGQVQATQM